MSTVPSSCPGTSSEEAGKGEPCQGCPNQKLCSSAKTEAPDPDLEIVRKRAESIGHIILVLSGKGGVGKSTVASLLAHSFAEDLSKNVGVMDIDICGPSMPIMMGVDGESVHVSGSGWSPVYVEENLAVISIGFLLPSRNDAVIWRGIKKNGLIKQFFKDVNWGDLDYLVIDTPPGTSDEHLAIVQYLKGVPIDGAVIVTTPQEIALLDVRKEITFCNKVEIPILGIVENMSGFVCPKCQVSSEVFSPTTGGAERMAKEMNVRFLGTLPLDPVFGRSCDEGTSVFEDESNSPAVEAARNLVKEIVSHLRVVEEKVKESVPDDDDDDEESKDDVKEENENASEGKEENTSEMKEENTSEMKEENTSEMKEENTSESKEENTSEMKEDNTSEMKEENTSESKEDNSSEMKEENTSESKEENTSEMKEEIANGMKEVSPKSSNEENQ